MNSGITLINTGAAALKTAVVTLVVITCFATTSPTYGDTDATPKIDITMNYSASNSYNSNTISIQSEERINVGNSELDRNLQKLKRYCTFGDNWNGYGAEPFEQRFLEEIAALLPNLNAQPQISPIDSGAIQMEYTKLNSEEYLEFELSAAPEVELFRIDKTGTEYYSSIQKSAVAINEVVNRFYAE